MTAPGQSHFRDAKTPSAQCVGGVSFFTLLLFSLF